MELSKIGNHNYFENFSYICFKPFLYYIFKKEIWFPMFDYFDFYNDENIHLERFDTTKIRSSLELVILKTIKKKFLSFIQNCGFSPSSKILIHFDQNTALVESMRLKITTMVSNWMFLQLAQKVWWNSKIWVFLGINFETHHCLAYFITSLMNHII